MSAAGQEADQQGQAILGLEANLSAADETRRSLRKQLAEVRCGCVWAGGGGRGCVREHVVSVGGVQRGWDRKREVNCGSMGCDVYA